MIVPFKRELRLGSTGRDVRAVKRALHARDPREMPNTTRAFGPGAVRALRLFEGSRGLPVNGVYEAADHEKLSPYFDAYGAWLMAHTTVIRPPAPRERLVAAALALYNYRAATEAAGHRDVHYSMTASRMTIVRLKLTPADYHPGLIVIEDCSSSCTGYYFQSGLPNPNGYPDYNPNRTMWTGTLCEHGVEVPVAYPGDLLFYGRGAPWSHVAIAVGDDVTRPTGRCVSHGHEGGPFLVDISYRRDVGQIRSYLPRATV